MLCQITAQHRHGNDTHPHLIALLSAVAGGWVPPETISEDDYHSAHQDNTVDAYTGFVGFCCSFGGKWWGGYARGNTSRGLPRNYAAEAQRNLVRQSALLQGTTFSCGDYREVPLREGATIYCDPPYANSLGYTGSGTFDTHAFWDWCSQLVSSGHPVLVSEYAAPSEWFSVWDRKVNNTLAKDTGSKQGVERLFVHESQMRALP